jgi:hypothetical protein
MGNDTMRDAMEAAFDEAETTDGEQEEETGGSPEDTSEPLGAAAEGEGEATGEELGGEGEGAAELGGEGEGEPAAGEPLPVSADDTGVAQPLGDAPGAPVSWKPAMREHWAGLPPEVQQEITRREGDITQGLQQAAGHKRVAEEYYRTVAPFQSFIQAADSSPAQAITQLMTTAVQLTQGSQAKKAEVVQNIIAEYGVDIGMLDELLAGQPVADDPNAPLLAAMDERLAPINSFMGQIGQQRQAQTHEINNEAAAELGAFQTSHSEFYEDLREDMADLLEMAANRGRTMTMEQAYVQAANAHPEIGPIITQRTAAAAGKLTPATAAGKRAAASSIHGTPNAKGAANVNVDDTRALMSELWDESEGGVGHG